MVPKPGKSDEFRLVVDYRYLNLHTVDDAHPIPNIEDLITDEAQNAIWTIFDLEDGFHQMHLDEASRPLTAFVTPWGQYQFNVLPMGCKNAPAMFQRMVNSAIKKSKSNIYIDDCLTGSKEVGNFSKLLEDHDRDVREVLMCFREHKLFVKGAKMYHFQRENKFCGYILSKGSRRAAPDKLKDIEAWAPDKIRTATQ